MKYFTASSVFVHMSQTLRHILVSSFARKMGKWGERNRKLRRRCVESEGNGNGEWRSALGSSHGQGKGQRLILGDSCSLWVKISANVKEYPNSIVKISAGVSTDNVFSGLYAYCGIAVHIWPRYFHRTCTKLLRSSPCPCFWAMCATKGCCACCPSCHMQSVDPSVPWVEDKRCSSCSGCGAREGGWDWIGRCCLS